jgi:hypothetical protein
MRLTVVVSLVGDSEVFMSRSDAEPTLDELSDDLYLRGLVVAMAKDALEDTLRRIDEFEAGE